MSNVTPVLKDENRQASVPSVWRKTLSDIVEALKEGDFGLERGIVGVRPISLEDASRISRNIYRYGDELESLPEEAWDTSACQWMGSYWDVLIDLYTVDEGSSDLVLAVRVYEDRESFVFEIQSVHVP